MRHDVYGLSDVGRSREVNEDRFLITRLQRAAYVLGTNVDVGEQKWLYGAHEGDLLVVADGMGGMGSGDVAASSAVTEVLRFMCMFMPWFATSDVEHRGETGGILERAVRTIDERVSDRAKGSDVSNTMGTTLTLGLLRWPRLYVAHVGDSRLYLIRNREIVQTTEDHTIGQKLAAEGIETADGAWGDALWNAVGGGSDAAKPDLRRLDLVADDILVFCSDGLTKHASADSIRRACLESETSQRAAERLVQMANDDGGTDNVTVIVSRFVQDAA